MRKMAKAFVIDISKCSGCYNCQLACKDEHVGNDWKPYAAPQPRIGQFWIRVVEKVEGTLPKVKIHYVPQLCNHCRSAECIKACPAEAIRRREDGLVLIDPDACTGCAHLLDHGAKMPRCVEACPTEAIRFGEEEDLKDDLLGAEVLQPESGCFPRIYYRNIPGRFIGGTLYDPAEKEVIIGARCLLTNGGKTWEAVSDEFGDFWFRDLHMGIYDLVVHAPGREYKRFDRIRLEKSVNLGDIPLLPGNAD